MRPTTHAIEVKRDKNGNPIAVNLGYAFCFEHDGGTMDTVNFINREYRMRQWWIEDDEDTPMPEDMKQKQMLMDRWENTPYHGYILNPDAPVYMKKIQVNNDGIKDKYHNFMLDNGEYTILAVSDSYGCGTYEDNPALNQKTVSEDELLRMDDYGFSFLLGPAMEKAKRAGIAGAWGSDGFMLISKGPSIPEYIADKIRNGSIAIVEEEKRLFPDRGFIIVDLDAAYGLKTR